MLTLTPVAPGSSSRLEPSLQDFQDPVWPRDSAFASVSHRRPPATRRISLQGSTPHEILLQATDQFSRGMLHMPSVRRPRSAYHHHHHNHSGGYFELHHPHPADDPEDIDTPPTLPGLGVLETRDAASIRPRVLYTIASDVMSVAERMPDAAAREYWANWSDIVFKQMEMESDVRAWVYATAVGRGRCWLIIGAARSEALEGSLESIGEAVLQSDVAADAREALHKGEHTRLASRCPSARTPGDCRSCPPAVTVAALSNIAPDALSALVLAIEHFERSRAIVQQPDLSPQQDPYSVELPPLIGEVCLSSISLNVWRPVASGLEVAQLTCLLGPL